jgi:iron complex transport system ATP-binding protein
VNNINFSYGSEPVLEGISHQFKPGLVTGLIGHNGCGKSTLVKILLGYLKPSGGGISFSSTDSSEFSGCLENHTRKTISRFISFVPQKTSVTAGLKAYDLVLMGRLPHVESRWTGFSIEDHESVHNVFDLLNLTDFKERSITSLSGGELQKLLLARCLVQDAPVLLLDEATSNLDLNHTIDIMELISALAKEKNKTVITVLHDLNLAAHYCDEIVMMHRGRVCFSGTPEDVITPSNLSVIFQVPMNVLKDENGTPFILPGRRSSIANEVCV